MKVLTVKTVESVSTDIQRDIHYTLRMEHQSDYVFKDMEDSIYSATISLEDTERTIGIIVENSSKIPEYTIEIDNLDMEENTIERLLVKDGKVLQRKTGSWDSEEEN